MTPCRERLLLGILALAIVAVPAFPSELGGLDSASESLGTVLRDARKTRTSALPAPRAKSSEDGSLSYASVCGGDGAALAAQREQRLKTGLRALEPQLRPRFSALAARYGLPAASGDDYIDSTLKSITYTFPYDAVKAKEALSAFSEAIEQAVLARVTLPDYARLKETMIARIRMKPTLSAEAKDALVRRIQLTTMMLPSRYIREYLTTTDELWPVVSLLASDQAWNVSYDDLGGAANPDLTPDQSLIIVYPGILLAEDRGDGSSHLDYVLAHEAAHSIDSGRFPRLYGGYIGCMKERGGTDFKAWDEVLADYWAADTLAQTLPDVAPEVNAGHLRDSFEIICGTSGDAGDSLIGRFILAEHPSGRYRIDNILGSDPGIRRSLGLPAAPAVCAL